jgi:integrase
MTASKHVFLQPGSKNYFIRYWHRGKKHVETSGTPDYKKAKKIYKDRVIELGADKLGLSKFIEPKIQKKTVDELLDLLKADYEIRGKWNPRVNAHIESLRKGSLIDGERDGKGIGDICASALTSEDVYEYIKNRRSKRDEQPEKDEQPENTANATINRETQLLKQAYKLFGKLGPGPKCLRLPEDNAREGFFEKHEFLAVVQNMPEDLKDFCWFGYLTGWRKGEIASLKWADLNLESKTMRLRHSESKNGEARWIMIEDGELLQLFQRRAEARAFKGKDGETTISEYVFHRKGAKIGDFEKSWASACEAANVGEKLFHDFRRTAARNMRRAGVPEEIAMKTTGHKTPSMFRRYNITNDEDIKKAIQQTQAFVSALPDKKGNVVGFAKAKAKRKSA